MTNAHEVRTVGIVHVHIIYVMNKKGYKDMVRGRHVASRGEGYDTTADQSGHYWKRAAAGAALAAALTSGVAEAAPVPTTVAVETSEDYEQGQEAPSTFVTMTSERVVAADQAVRSGVASRIGEVTNPSENQTAEQVYNNDDTLILSMNTVGVGSDAVFVEKPTLQSDGSVAVYVMRTTENPGGAMMSSDTVRLVSASPEAHAVVEGGRGFTVDEINSLLIDSTTRVESLTHLTPGGETNVTLYNDPNLEDPARSKVGFEVSAAGPYDYKADQPTWENLSVDAAGQKATEVVREWSTPITQ